MQITYTSKLKILFWVLLADIIIIMLSGCKEKTPCQEFLEERSSMIIHKDPGNAEALNKIDQLITMYCHCGDEAPEDPNEVQFSSFPPLFPITVLQEDPIITIKGLQEKGWKYIPLTEREYHKNPTTSGETYTRGELTLELKFVGKYRLIRLYFTNNKDDSGMMVKLEVEKARMSVIDKLYNTLVGDGD